MYGKYFLVLGFQSYQRCLFKIQKLTKHACIIFLVCLKKYLTISNFRITFTHDKARSRLYNLSKLESLLSTKGTVDVDEDSDTFGHFTSFVQLRFAEEYKVRNHSKQETNCSSFRNDCLNDGF